ncbi:MAG: PorP/SprF family type IX secretion system membrane protein [Chitinophagales bacterium]
MKKLYTTLLAALAITFVTAQDVHYTQFYNSPLTLNPAMTGLTQGTFRVGVHYRNQWFTGVNNGFFRSPFQTPSIYFDMPIKVFRNDHVGVGAVILADLAGAGSMNTYMGMVSGSYIKSLGKDHNHQLSAGFQVGYTQLRIKQDDLHWASQAQNNEFNSSLPAGIALKPNVSYVNLNVGLMYYGRIIPKLDLYAGAAFFNATTPKYNLGVNEAKKDLNFRWNISAGLDAKLGKQNRFHLLPSALFMRQSTADQLNIGMGLGYDITREANLTLGGYARVNNLTNKDAAADAGIAYVALDVKGFKIGASYDFTASKFKTAGPGVGGLEISLTYTGHAKNYDLRNIMFCPRF